MRLHSLHSLPWHPAAESPPKPRYSRHHLKKENRRMLRDIRRERELCMKREKDCTGRVDIQAAAGASERITAGSWEPSGG